MAERLIVWHRWLPPRGEDAAHLEAAAEWSRSVAARLEASGGELLGTIGASVVAAFDPSEIADVADVCLDLLDEADHAGIEVTFGAAVGPLTDAFGTRPFGPPIELAQLLATRARPGELVLGPRAKVLATDNLLFGRQVAAGAGAPRGITVDRSHPRVLDCADAIAKLGSPGVPPVVRGVMREIEAALERGDVRNFVLRGPVGAGATEIVNALERSRTGRIWRIGAAPGGLVPLASLRLALLRRLGSPDNVASAFRARGASAEAVDAMERVARGELAARAGLAAALAELLGRESEAGRPWVLLSPLSLVDGATLGALLEARERGGDFVLFGRYPVEPELPRPLAELDEEIHELLLPPLKTSDARAVAEAILGPGTDEEVVRPVAVLGGDTIIGVVEAARTLLATGELVHDGAHFVWRAGPRTGAAMMSADELLSRRLSLLDGQGHRVLETLCVVPDGWERDLLEKVAERDGVTSAAFAQSLDILTREALARGQERPRPASSLLRWRVLSLIPPSRSMELHRFVGEVVRELALDDQPLRAELGYFLVEGGVEEEGCSLLAGAIEPMLLSGYERAARQLAGWLTAVGERRAASFVGARPTPAPPRLESHEAGPPSSEFALDEILEEAAESMRPPPPPPPPPPVALPAGKRPPPPPRRPTPPQPISVTHEPRATEITAPTATVATTRTSPRIAATQVELPPFDDETDEGTSVDLRPVENEPPAPEEASFEAIDALLEEVSAIGAAPFRATEPKTSAREPVAREGGSGSGRGHGARPRASARRGGRPYRQGGARGSTVRRGGAAIPARTRLRRPRERDRARDRGRRGSRRGVAHPRGRGAFEGRPHGGATTPRRSGAAGP